MNSKIRTKSDHRSSLTGGYELQDKDEVSPATERTGKRDRVDRQQDGPENAIGLDRHNDIVSLMMGLLGGGFNADRQTR